jgi:hypothetical protein
MRKLITLFLMLLVAPLAHAVSATYVTGCVNQIASSGQSVTCTYATSQAVGTLLVISSKHDNTAGDALTFAATVAGATASCTSSGNVQTQTGLFTSTWAACLVTGAGTPVITGTWAGATTDGFISIESGSYTATSGFVSATVDKIAPSVNATSTTCSSGTTGVTTNPNELVVFTCDNWNAAQTYGVAPSGFSANRSASSRNTTGWWDKSITATGTQSASTTIVSDVSIGTVLTFQLNSGASASTRGKAVMF